MSLMMAFWKTISPLIEIFMQMNTNTLCVDQPIMIPFYLCSLSFPMLLAFIILMQLHVNHIPREERRKNYWSKLLFNRRASIDNSNIRGCIHRIQIIMVISLSQHDQKVVLIISNFGFQYFRWPHTSIQVYVSCCGHFLSSLSKPIDNVMFELIRYCGHFDLFQSCQHGICTFSVARALPKRAL